MNNTQNPSADSGQPAQPKSDPAGNLWLYKLIYSLKPAHCGVLLKKLCGLKRRAVSVSRGTFYVDPCSHFGLVLLQYDGYEHKMSKILDSTLHEGSSFVDLGANEGYFSVVAAKLVGEEGRVVAVEPQSRLQPILKQNFLLNGCRNVTLKQAAISNTNGSMKLYLTPDTNTGSTSLFKTRNYPLPSETIPLISLNQLLDENNIETVDLMKMDIESYEYEAILGAQNAFRSKRIRTLIFELHTWMLRDRGLNPDDITNFLTGAGYSLTEFDKFVVAQA